MANEETSAWHEPIGRRKLLMGALFAASAGIVFARKPTERIDYLGSRELETIVPKRIGGWQFETTSGLVVPPEDPLSDSLYSDVLTRVYTNGVNPPVMLLVAQSAGQTGVLQIHRPEVCYPAGGFQLSAVKPISIATPSRLLPASQLTATAPGRPEQILYWTRVGDTMPTSWSEQRWAVARDNLEGKIPDAVLVRVSTIDPDETVAKARLVQFVEGLIAGMPSGSQRVLIA